MELEQAGARLRSGHTKPGSRGTAGGHGPPVPKPSGPRGLQGQSPKGGREQPQNPSKVARFSPKAENRRDGGDETGPARVTRHPRHSEGPTPCRPPSLWGRSEPPHKLASKLQTLQPRGCFVHGTQPSPVSLPSPAHLQPWGLRALRRPNALTLGVQNAPCSALPAPRAPHPQPLCSLGGGAWPQRG